MQLWGFLVLTLTCAAEKFAKYGYQSDIDDSELFRSTFTESHLAAMRKETEGLFRYGFDRYLEKGWPQDEVTPITCKANGASRWNFEDTVKNDVMGNYTVTLVDNIDTFVVMGDRSGFEKAVDLVRQNFDKFDSDANVQVFEANIRVLGGLLTAHLYATDPRRGFQIDGYDGFLLRLAYDLGKRLVLAFDNGIDTPSTEDIRVLIPFPRTNLKKGPGRVPRSIQKEQCTAGVTSLIVEFAMLSRLTGDPLFEEITRYTFLRIWYTRSELDLLPMTIRTQDFAFQDSLTGVGASIDSFYEYALKYACLFNDDKFFEIWAISYRALLTHSQNKQGLFINVDVHTGMEATPWIDALGGFFPGLQVLAGDIENAVKFHRVYLKLWNYYGAIPERWNYNTGTSSQYFSDQDEEYKPGDIIPGLDEDQTNEVLLRNSLALEWYPLRPEFVESTYHLYRATHDPLYLRIGEDFLKRFREEYIAPCGFSGVLDIRTGSRQDRMESFVLSETLKYLYLLFDEANPIHSDDGNAIFSTEGHLLWYDEVVKSNSAMHLFETGDGNRAKSQPASRFSIFTDYDEVLEGSFDRLRKKFNQNVLNGSWSEVRVTPEIKERLRDTDLGKMSVGQRALVIPELQEMLQPYYSALKRNGTRRDVYNVTVDSDYLSLQTCQQKRWQGAFSSALGAKDLYDLDHIYAITLRRPPYLPEDEHSELELGSPFYELFGDPHAETCTAEQDTTLFEAVLDTGKHFGDAKISRMCNGAGVYIEDMDGFRGVFESVEEGDLDRFGEYVSASEFAPYNGTVGKLFRVVKINGYGLRKNEAVWVDKKSERLYSSEGIEVSGGGQIWVNGVPVENMRVLGNPGN